MALYKMKHVG